jgi:hypothetical protein
MSQENVELAHRSVDAINRRDLDAYLSLMDVDIAAISRLAAIEAPFRAMTVSAVGGTPCSTSGLTSRRRLWNCIPLGT